MVGDGGVGKIIFVKWYVIGEFEKKYVVIFGVEVYFLKFYIICGEIIFNVWDIVG